jgi:hypothetical protein
MTAPGRDTTTVSRKNRSIFRSNGQKRQLSPVDWAPVSRHSSVWEFKRNGAPLESSSKVLRWSPKRLRISA